MNLESYFSKLKSKYPNIKLPQIVIADDYNESQLFVDGKWLNVLYGCGIIEKNGSTVYFETDQERGYISVIKEFDDQGLLEQYINNRFLIIANASREINTREEMAIRFVQQKYNYSEKQAKRMVAQIAKHKDIFEEFLIIFVLINYVKKTAQRYLLADIQLKDWRKKRICLYWVHIII